MSPTTQDMDKTPATMRLDKWLFSARLFASRALAAQAIEGNLIKLNGQPAKPNKQVKPQDEITLKREGRTYGYTIQHLLPNRVSAPLAQAAYILTIDAHLSESMRQMADLLHEQRQAERKRHKGPFKPNKKERRALQKLKEHDY
jgi:ribosome-associated heat shock protein Hsp15